MISYYNKKAVGHVETVLSFVIFIGFLLFLFTIFNPISGSKDSGVVDSVILKMGEQLTTKVNSMSINLNDSINNCFSIELIEDLKCVSGEIIVKDKDGNMVKADVRITGIQIENSGLNKFYTIYCSKELIGNSISGCDSITEGNNYTLGIIVERNPWSEKKISDFVVSYTDDYNGLRTQIVPQGNDFRFFIWDLNDLDGTALFEASRKTSLGTRIDSKTIGIGVLDNKANITQRTLNIQVW